MELGITLENALSIAAKTLNAIGAAALIVMMLLTVADVLMRALGHENLLRLGRYSQLKMVGYGQPGKRGVYGKDVAS